MVVSCADKFKSTPNNISVWRFYDKTGPTPGSPDFRPEE